MLPTDHPGLKGWGLVKSLVLSAPQYARIVFVDPMTGFNLPTSEIKVQYNPEELSLNQSAKIEGAGNRVFFHRTEPDNLVVSLIFDTYEARSDVRKKTDKVLKLTEPKEIIGVGNVPPTVRFVWADNLFTGIVTKVEQKFTMFLGSGIPVRADVTVTFTEVLTDKEESAALGLGNCRRLLQVSAGDRLDLVAHRALGDRRQWRLIAHSNGIYDPIGFAQQQWAAQTIAVPDTHNETFEAGGASDYV